MDDVRVSVQELEALSRDALRKAGLPEAHADAATDVLVTADLFGISTHGTRRLGPYIRRIQQGLMNPTPDIVVTRKAPSLATVAGDNGMGPVVGAEGLRVAIALAQETGIGYVGCSGSNHFGAIAPYALTACEQGLISVIGTNAFPTMAPWGGREVKVGNNPLGVGVPRRQPPHFILDIAMSVAARGKMRAAHERGETIPAGWALDAQGRPTVDPLEALKGFVLPIGGHKGYGLALAIDVLAGVLTGAAYGPGVGSLFQNMREPQRIGHFFLVIDPKRFMDDATYHERLEDLFRQIKDTEPFDEQSPVMLPGEPEWLEREKRLKEGIPMPRDIYDMLVQLAAGRFDGPISAY